MYLLFTVCYYILQKDKKNELMKAEACELDYVNCITLTLANV